MLREAMGEVEAILQCSISDIKELPDRGKTVGKDLIGLFLANFNMWEIIEILRCLGSL